MEDVEDCYGDCVPPSYQCFDESCDIDPMQCEQVNIEFKTSLEEQTNKKTNKTKKKRKWNSYIIIQPPKLIRPALSSTILKNNGKSLNIPIYDQYDIELIAEVELPPTLISRFDNRMYIFFIIKIFIWK